MNGKKERYFWRYSQCYELLHTLLTYFLVSGDDMLRRGEEKHGEENSAGGGRSEELLHYIEMYYERDLSLNELAEKFHLSVSYLSRYFKKMIGMNFTDYLYTVRMRHAVEELLDTDHPVTRVSLDHGFPSVSVFNRQFREKYSCTPTEYRLEMKKDQKPVKSTPKEREQELIRERLKEHFGVLPKGQEADDRTGLLEIDADTSKSREYHALWNRAINVGSAETLLYSDVREAVLYAHRELYNRYVRFWNLFGEGLFIVKDGKWGQNSFAKINQVIQFLLENQMKPIIELGEKPKRILLSPGEFVKEPDNVSNFRNYGQFLDCLTALMKNFVSYFGREEVNTWLFELWEDRRVEVYRDKVPYMQLYRDCSRIIKEAAPGAQLGGAGNHLGWYQEHTDESVRKWIDNGIYPDYLTYTYYPYAAGDKYQERFSKRKSDESDVAHSLDYLNQVLFRYGFPERKLVITDWNMSMSSRNYFHDSLWKGCYVLKCFLESMGKAEALVYAQLIDTTTDYVDSQTVINGSGGLLTRDLIEKPAFIAMRMLAKLRPRLVAMGDGYIVTGDEDQDDLAVLMYNFIGRNYLYYIKAEHENRVEDHYRYFENQDGKRAKLTLRNLPQGAVYEVRQYIVNRDSGSVMDEWMGLSCVETPRHEDIEYLKKICTPRVRMGYEKAEGGTLAVECYLKPLEMRMMTLKRLRE